MSNMSYCRFQNTYSDLQDCHANLDNELSREENQARRNMLRLMAEMLQDIGLEIDQNELSECIHQWTDSCQDGDV